MNKVIFNKGGQPIYLDDMELVQENGFEMMRSLIYSLTGVDEPCLLHPYTYQTKILDNENGIVKMTILANAIVYNGEIVHFDTASFTNREIEEKGAVKVCVKSSASDLRTFNDGQQHHCRRSLSAYLNLSGAGADAFYEITNLKTIPELLARRIGYDSSVVVWRDVPVVFYNEYSGTVQYSEGSSLQVKIDVRTTAKEWESGKRGVICEIADYTLVKKLAGKGSPLSAIPLRPDGTFMGTGSVIAIGKTGGINIVNRVNNGPLSPGYLPPVFQDDEYSTIVITF